jgi:uncharacterized membrane protein YeaQ/YmgE (transglycosylase-associated protein family)
MGIISWIILGLVVGLLAKFFMPGKDPGGIIVTILIGIAGAIIGGYFGRLLGIGDVKGFDLTSLLLALGSSILLLFVYRILKKKQS